jgi:transcriptional antiterminator RfaH
MPAQPVLAESDSASARTWFCVRAQPRHEHIAAAHLRQMDGVEVFSPRIRFLRSTRQGPVWVTESLFPNYLFARFDLKIRLAQVQYAPGVSGIVHFGRRWPVVPDEAIADLRGALGEKEVHVIPRAPESGDEVSISGGTFHGLQATVLRVMPARERVLVLLDFLGRQTAVEVDLKCVVRPAANPLHDRGR